jgi:hypothetical protein
MTVTKVSQAGLSLTEAFSGVLQTNANFVDQVIFGPAVDGRAWNGLWNKASVFSSLMLATIEDEGSNTEINIWDLTQQSAGSPSTTVLATVDLSAAATPTSIAASMGYLIVSSEDGIAIIDPHSGAWAERTKGWPRTLSSSTSPALTNNDVVSVCAGLSDQPAYDPRTGGPFPTFGLVYGTGADCSAIIKDDGTSYDQAGTVGGKGCAIFNGFFVYPDTAAGRMKRNGLPISTITADDWAENDMGQPGSYPEILGSDQQISFSSTLGALCDANGLSLVSGLNQVKSAIQGIGMSALINRTYNTGYLPVDIRGAWLANSKTVDRSYKGNTLTENGTVTEAVVETSAELKGYSGFSSSNYLRRAHDTDLDFGTGDFSASIWVKFTTSSANEQIFHRARPSSAGSVATNGQISLYIDTTSVVVFYLRNDTTGAADTCQTTQAVDDSVWHHVVAVKDTTQSKLFIYLDGVLAATDSGALTSGSQTDSSATLSIGVDSSDTTPAPTMSASLFRMSATVPTATQVRQMYDAEKGMFVASAECLLQSGSTDAVLDVNVDPLTNKVLVTQTDAITVFDGLVVDSKPTVNSGSSEKGKLWGDLRSEQNSANAYVTAPAVDQRQVNEMVRGLANELPKGVDLSKAKAWVNVSNASTPAIESSFNIKSISRPDTGEVKVTFGIPFKTDKYIMGAMPEGGAEITITQSTGASTREYATLQTYNATTITNLGFSVAFFGELENE